MSHYFSRLQGRFSWSISSWSSLVCHQHLQVETSGSKYAKYFLCCYKSKRHWNILKYAKEKKRSFTRRSCIITVGNLPVNKPLEAQTIICISFIAVNKWWWWFTLAKPHVFFWPPPRCSSSDIIQHQGAAGSRWEGGEGRWSPSGMWSAASQRLVRWKSFLHQGNTSCASLTSSRCLLSFPFPCSHF